MKFRMTSITFAAIAITRLAVPAAMGQAPAAAPKPAAAKPAPVPVKPAPAPVKAAPAKPAPAASAKLNPQVEDVIEKVKMGLSEGMILRGLQAENKPVKLTNAEMAKLKQAGVSENIMSGLMYPATIAASAQAADPTPAPVQQATSTPAPTPAAAPTASPDPAAPAAPAQAGAGDPATSAQRKRMIVNAFDFSATISKEDAIWGTNQNLGKGIRAMFVTRAQQGGKIVVIERGEKLNQVTGQQDMNAGNRVKQGTGAQIGRIEGADAILAGDIIVFGRDDKKTNVAGGGYIGAVVGGIKRKDNVDKAVVAISYRLIDAETSEVIASGEARGEASRTGKKRGVFASLGQAAVGIDISSSNSGFKETIIGEATQDCLNKLGDILNEQAAKMKKRSREVETTVVLVSGNNLTIGAGANAAVNVGEVFEIHKILSVIKDPVTGEKLDEETKLIGHLTINAVRPNVATGTYVGTPPLATKDFKAIKRMPAQQ